MTGFLQWIKQRARVWKIAGPVPGGGFHFCAARVRTADGELATLDDYLHKTQRGKVVVVDASALPDLGCRPSALTMMANSHRQVERCVQN
jgi:choline dehydrogenase-like flavoprotein